jgi:cyclopropane-fatty-acyl-phospholipid synthase
MQYSCAYWDEGVTTLEEAQAAKKRHIARKLLIEPGMEVLDIGCGWGGMALTLARDFGARVTGVTLSKDQYETCLRRAEKAGLADRVTFKLLDYRLETGVYDRVVSVGMFEHIGRPYFGEYFSHLYRLLKPDGVALIHSIAKMRDPGPSNEWITKYIFPGGYLPTLSELAPVIERQRFWLADLEVLRLHYAETLKEWNIRFQKHRATFAKRFDERFCRMWEFYLLGCEASFRHQECCVFQMQLAKQVGAVPITRAYLYRDRGQPAAQMIETGHREAAE